MTTTRANPDYSACAAKAITNTEHVGDLLREYRVLQNYIRDTQAKIEAATVELQKQLRSQELDCTTLMDMIKTSVELEGCYQDTEAGMYAIKQRKVSLSYVVDLVRANLPENVANLIIEPMVNKTKIEGLVKGKIISDEQAKACAKATETYAWIIK